MRKNCPNELPGICFSRDCIQGNGSRNADLLLQASYCKSVAVAKSGNGAILQATNVFFESVIASIAEVTIFNSKPDVDSRNPVLF